MSESVVFDRAADYYDQTRGFPPGEDKHVAALLARVGNWNKQSRVLEIAVGTGRIAAPLASLVAEMVGVDLSLAMMARVRTKPAGDSIRLAQADVTRLPFGDRSVDGASPVGYSSTAKAAVGMYPPKYGRIFTALRRNIRPISALTRVRTINF